MRALDVGHALVVEHHHPPRIGQAQEGRHAGIAAIRQPRRDLGLAPALHMLVWLEQRCRQLRFLSRHCIHGRIWPGSHPAITAFWRQQVHAYHPLGAQLRHTVVGDDHQIGVDVTPPEPVEQAADRLVDPRDGLRGRLGARTGIVARMVDVVEIQREEAESLRRWPVQPGQQRVDPFRGRHLAVKGRRHRRAHAMDRCLRTGPEHGCAANTVQFRRHPYRLRLVPPAAVGDGSHIAVAETLVRNRGVRHHVVDDAVMVGPQPGDQRVMIRERH